MAAGTINLMADMQEDRMLGDAHGIEYDPCKDNKEPDVTAFNRAITDRKMIFMERRAEHGSHFDNNKRFPLENFCGLYLKCARTIRAIEAAVDMAGLDDVSEDTLIDAGNYADFIRSSRKHRG